MELYVRNLTLFALLFCFTLSVSYAFGQSPNKGYDTTGVDCDDWREPDWSKWLARKMGLDPIKACEVRTYDGSRVDILTKTEAIEVEWASKWKEAIGQSMLYSTQTNRKASIILLSDGDDKIFLLRCQSVCSKSGILLRVQRVPKPKRNRIVDP